MYDPLAKVPLIIKYPQNAHQGQVNERISSNIDIAPTLIKQADIQVPKVMKGLDLSNQEVGRDFALCEGLRVDMCNGVQETYYEYMIRTKNHKLIISKNLQHYKFFDLINDPYELNNVAQEAQYQEVIQKHMHHLVQTMTFEALSPIYVNEEEKTFTPEKATNQEERDAVETYYKARVPHCEL